MRKLLLGSVCSLMLFSFAVKADCTAAPECASLGYTKTESECPKGALKCPYGETYYGDTYFCEEACDNIIKIGSFLYSDFSICSNLLENKQVLGVVVYLDSSGEHGQAMATWSIDLHGNNNYGGILLNWANDDGTYYDIDNLPNHASYTTAATDYNSCANTDIILADTQITYPAARATRLYAPTAETRGKWCLPAAGILSSIHYNMIVVSSAISKAGGKGIIGGYLWSSSERSDYGVWCLSSGDDTHGLNTLGKHSDVAVYPVIEF